MKYDTTRNAAVHMYRSYLLLFQCEPGSIHCHNGTCIPYSKICDGVKDCPENEDETYTDCSLFGMAGLLNIQARFNLFHVQH